MEDIYIIYSIFFINLMFINLFIIFLYNKYNKYDENIKILYNENNILKNKIYNISSTLYNKDKNNYYITKYKSGINFDLKRIYNNNVNNFMKSF